MQSRGQGKCQEVGRPYSSSQRSHTSLSVGYDGTACQSRSIGTSPTIATVAECSSSATSGPDEGRADQHAAVLVDDRPRHALVVVGVGRGAGDPREVVVQDADAATRRARGGLGESDRRDLRVGEGDLRHVLVIRGRDVRAPRRVATASPFARAAITSPAARAWYLPWWVSSARWLTSPTA